MISFIRLLVIIFATAVFFGLESGRIAPKNPISKPEEAIVKIREKCIKTLEKAARHKNAFIRSAAYRAAGESGDFNLIPLLRKGTQDIYPTARLFSLQTIKNISKKEAITLAEKMISDPDVWVRSLALETLGELGGPSYVPTIKAFLKDRDEIAVMAAATALVKLGRRSYSTFLTKHLKGTFSQFRNHAIGFLGNLLDSEAQNHLASMLDDSDEQALFYVLKALAKDPKPEWVSKLRELVHHINPSIRKEAVNVLGKLDASGTEPLLQAVCLDSDAMVRLTAALALNRIGSKACRTEFSKALANEDYGVRSAGARILGDLNLPGKSILLAKTLSDENSRVRTAAVRAIGKMGGYKAVSLLFQALNDPQEVIRVYAAGNLIGLMK